MSRMFLIFSLISMTVGLGRCASTCSERDTASDSKVEAYRPALGEIRRD